MLRQQSDTTASLIPSATGTFRRPEPCFRPFSDPTAVIFSGTGRRSVLPEPTDVKGGGTGLSPVLFSRTFRLLLPAGCTDPYRAFPVLSCAKRSQPLRNAGATSPVHCYPCGDPQRRDRPARNDRSRTGLPVHHSGECAALTCYREGGRPERSTPSHSPFGFPKHPYIYSSSLFHSSSHPQGADGP